MRLTYRFANYEYTPPSLEVTEGEILGSYRGINWRCRTVETVPVPQLDIRLTYRGATYSRNATRGACPVDMVRAATARGAKTVHVPDALPVLREISRIHRSNLERNLERRLLAAQQRGDQALVSMLEDERRQLVEA